MRGSKAFDTGNQVKIAPVKTAQDFIHNMEDIHARLVTRFPKRFSATKKTVAEDIDWMKRQAG